MKPAPPNLLLILADTARADAFQPWFASAATPNVGRLAREGVTYATAISQAPWTLPSTASIFSGVLPTVHGITGDSLRWIDGRRTSPSEKVANYKGDWLPESIRERGYRTWAVSSNGWISGWGGFARGFDDFHDIRPWRTASTPVRRLLRASSRCRPLAGRTREGERLSSAFVASSKRDKNRGSLLSTSWRCIARTIRHEGSALLWPPAERSAMLGDPLALLAHQLLQTRLRAHASPSYIRSIRSLYEACGRYVDSLVSAFVEVVPDGTPLVVVLMSDHGESLGEHGLFGHHSSLHEPLLRVPLVVWSRGLSLKPGLIEEPVSCSVLQTRW